MPGEPEPEARIVDAVRGERAGSLYGGIRQRPWWRRHRWAAGVAVVVVAAAAAVLLSPEARRDVPSAEDRVAGDWSAEFERDCRAEWDRAMADPTWVERLLPADRAAMPPLRFDFRSGDRGLRLYAGPRVMFDCQRHASGTSGSPIVFGDTPGHPMFTSNGTDLQYLATGSVRSGGYLVGAAPPGTTRVEAVLADGETLPGRVDGDLFAVWSAHADMSAPVLRLYVGDQVIAEGPPTWLRGDFHPATFSAACEKQIRATVGESPPLRFRFHAGDFALWLYGDEHVMAPCWLRRDGHVTAGLAYRPVKGEVWQPFQRTMAAGDGFGWVFGRAPVGALRVEAILPDGRRVPAKLADGFFAAWWPSADPAGLPWEIRAETAAGTLVHRDNAVTTR